MKIKKPKDKRQKVTFHTRLTNGQEVCQDLAIVFNQALRFLFAHPKLTLSTIGKKFNLDSYWTNSLNYAIKQKTKAHQGAIDYQNKLLIIRIRKLKNKIKFCKDKVKLHHLKRRLYRLQQQQFHLKQQGLVFGGRPLWLQQFVEGQDHTEWQQLWFQQRHSEFSLVGRSRENQGNNSCQLHGTNLHLRLPEALWHKYGKTFIFTNIAFPYGQGLINNAIKEKQPLFYRFVKKDKGWYVCVTVCHPQPATISDRYNGCLGVDINPRLIGWAVCDKEGNLQTKSQQSFHLGNTNQTKDQLSRIVVKIVREAVKRQVPIAIEDLNFCQKKAEAKGRYARMLNGFAYNFFRELLVARAYKFGIEVKTVSSRFSSVIGLHKFMAMYGMNSATAAALVLARRLLWKSERLPAKSTTRRPEDRRVHVWSHWQLLAKKSNDVKRHSFFTSKANSLPEVTPDDGLCSCQGKLPCFGRSAQFRPASRFITSPAKKS